MQHTDVNHPNSQLARGEARNARHALELLCAAYAYEVRASRQLHRDIQADGEPLTDADLAPRQYAVRLRTLAEHGLTAYETASAAGTLGALYTQWQASDDEERRRLGTSLASGEYEALAF